MREPTRLEIAKETAQRWKAIAKRESDKLKAQQDIVEDQTRYIHELQDRIEDHGGRICTECGAVITEGYCIAGGLEYYCDDECLHKHYTPEEREERYDDGNSDSYRTEREDDNH